jgi:DNA-binding NarL/FixJ family response regulator
VTAPRVVLVDDTEDLRNLLRIALKRAGWEVVGEAGDGAAGIEVATAEDPDLVVLDLSMPVMDGLEALPHIRTSCPDATIVVMSGFGAAQMTERALAGGADGYLQKGAPLATVVDYLGATMARRGSPPAAAAALVPEEDGDDLVELAPVPILEPGADGGRAIPAV